MSPASLFLLVQTIPLSFLVPTMSGQSTRVILWLTKSASVAGPASPAHCCVSHTDRSTYCAHSGAQQKLCKWTASKDLTGQTCISQKAENVCSSGYTFLNRAGITWIQYISWVFTGGSRNYIWQINQFCILAQLAIPRYLSLDLFTETPNFFLL